LEALVQNWLQKQPHRSDVKIYSNPAGDWDIGGFDADTGLTGRKIAIDSYGPRIPIGGGAFSGKDATKVDRSAAYMARRVAVDYLRKRSAKETYCLLAYAIGVAEPVEAVVVVDGKEEAVLGYDLTPKGIIDLLNLRQPQFELTAQYGHFGNNFRWDK
jgi:S-adenosylmethionine synthetase